MSRTVCLIPGWGMRAMVWNEIIADLETTYPVVPLEWSGPDAAPQQAYDLSAIASRIPAGSVIIGWSLGGQIAMQLAIDHPDRVDRLILIGTSPCFVQRDDWAHGLPETTVASFVEGFASDPSQTQKRFVALQALGDGERRHVTRHLTQALIAADERILPQMNEGLRLLESNDLRARIGQIRCPVRIFHGDNDALMPVAAAHWLADHIEGAQLTCFADAGHAPFLSRRQAFLVMARRFIDG